MWLTASTEQGQAGCCHCTPSTLRSRLLREALDTKARTTPVSGRVALTMTETLAGSAGANVATLRYLGSPKWDSTQVRAQYCYH